MMRFLFTISALIAFVLLPSSTLANQATTGCHAWAPIFRPTLDVLSDGQIEVALPTYLPSLPPGVRAVATVLEPPKTYSVTLTTSPKRPNAGMVLRIRGNAGNHFASLGAVRLVMANGKRLRLQTQPHALVKAGWFAGGITYTVAAVRSMPRATLLHIAGSLLPAALHPSPIGDSSGPAEPACP